MAWPTWNGAGTFTRTAAQWQNDAAAGTLILADRHDNNDQGLATGINACLAKNGENAFTGTTGSSAFRGAVDNTSDLGSTSLRWRNLYAGTSVVFQGASFATTVTAAPTANRAVVLPDKAGTLGLTAQYLVTAFSANTGTTTVPFLPSGLDADLWSEITVIFEGVSLTTVGGADDILLQLIDTAGVVSTNYRSRCMTINNATMSSASFTTGFGFSMGNASGTLYGSITLRREAVASVPGGDGWNINGSLVNGIGTNGQLVVGGTGYLSSQTPTSKLAGLRLASSTDDTFDSGTIYVTGRI